MKNLKNLMGLVMAAIVVSLGFVSCNKEEDGLGAANAQDKKASLIITEKEEEPKPVLKDSSWVKVSHDIITIVVEHFRNDTLINADSTKCNFGASIKRVENKLQTTEARLANLDFSFGEVTTSRNGKNQFVGKQQVTDEDGQTYNGELLSGYCTLGSLKDVHAELVSFKKTNLQNEALEPGADEAKLVNTKIQWNYVVSIVNAPNLEGKTFELTTNNTEHLRYIPKNAPELISTDTTMVRRPDNWFTEWDLIIKESWSNDSVAEKKKTVRTNASVEAITLEDKFVSSFDYSYTNNDLAWGAWKAIQSNDSSVSLEEQEGSKLGNASNGYSNDAFDTKYVAKRQRATVLFGGFKWNIPAEEVTLSTTRKVFVEQTSDLDGYSMVKFVNDEIARYNNANDKTLTESCKLYLKLKEPEIIDYILVDGSDYKTRTENSVKVGLTIKPKYDDGTFGKEIPFKMERAESWVWLKDSVIYENVDFFMQETAEKLELVGDLKKTAKTQRDNGGVFSFNEYEGDFRAKVTSNGMTKYTTWHAVWSEDFTFTYTDENGKSFKHTFDKSNYNVKAQNDQLKKNESKSSVTSEVYDYSVDGIFAIDNVTRSAYGYGRFQKTIDERIIRTYWDEASKGQSHTVLESTRWATLVREYNTGKKTTQEYKHVFNRLSGSSKWEITAEEGSEAAANALILENANEENRADDFAHFTLKKFELGQFFNVPGAAQQHDKVTFTESMGAYFEVKDQDGNPIKVYFEDPSYSFTNDVKALTVKSENDSETIYQHENVVNWSFGGAVTTLSATGLIHVAKASPVTPNFDIEVGKIFATVSRPSNRNGVNGDITAYTYLLVSKDGKKCLPIGIYNNVVTAGEITDMVSGLNSACYVLNENKVVATVCTLNNGIIKYKDANGKMVDGGMFIEWQSAGFNNRGNSYENWQHKYAPRATKKGNVTVVTFEGTNVSYTFKGWNVQ